MNQSQHNRRNYLNGRVKAAATILLLITAVLVSGFVWANSRVVIRVDGKTMNVNASALDATLTSTPANPSSSRTAQFSFSGTGAAVANAPDHQRVVAHTLDKRLNIGLAGADLDADKVW